MTGNEGLGRFSTGSPVSSRFAQSFGPALGTCHDGTTLLIKGSLMSSETSWVRAATSAKLVESLKTKKETLASREVAKARVWTKTVLPCCLTSKAVWKPPIQQPPKKKSAYTVL